MQFEKRPAGMFMWRFWRQLATGPRDTRGPSPRGLVFFLAILFLLYSAVNWLREDPRFSGALQLTSAFRYVLTQGAIDATPEMVFEAAVNGLTAPLDPFSGYMPAEELGYFEEETEGEYVGIGVEIKVTAGRIIIVRVFPQTPAAEALIQPGDAILAIDGTPTLGLTLSRAIELMRGEEGTLVDVRLSSPDGEERELTLERRAVSVSPFPIHGISFSGCAYIRWTDFTVGSADRLAALVEGIRVEQPIGIILDLRGNPGGLLEEAVNAAGIFLPPDQLICKVVDRGGRNIMEYRTAESPATFTGPLAIVLDENSASASEVIAAALQELGRAVVVGRRSYGKGWVQNVFEFEDGSALRLSTARYYTPAGRTFGDPRVRIPADSVAGDSAWFGPSGLEPDTMVEELEVGPWEDALARRGLFADFAIAYADDWPGDDLAVELRFWCDSLGIIPEGLAAHLVAAGNSSSARRLNEATRAEREQLLLSLDSAWVRDRTILFAREIEALTMRLWEQRMIAVERPDEAELDEYLSADPDLAAARDLLEQPERYNAYVGRWRSQMAALPAAR
jgi:carboxyl-terminal processing protease